jgi:hypothetical protein
MDSRKVERNERGVGKLNLNASFEGDPRLGFV